MARSKLRLLCTSMLVAILLFLYAALLCSCKTADPEISGTMWVELSLDGQYALTNAAGQTLRYFDLLQYDGTMPVEKTTAGDLTLTQKEEALLRGDAEYTCTLKNGNGDIVAEQTYPAGAEASISLERGTLSDNG